ncbi:MAG: CHAT domain-containing protein [Limnospira sp. PMC 1291.21]|uniref:CHAT domain-containing protein n=1 Tax=unclassified Limnospira TaxID=2642885 RepID=UPI0028E0E7CB|nr:MULTISPECIES: CHAT domain-containing tetratricopeptide repeat protein [unclassified Limnospira]MDT9177458.1 CHAT domain-containing protein [Limnospira sp. PMC 1238.20]MDT9192737.1 CHAT domain-containing protein [Limnospira sp. PMC 1245.20]MDT9202287.1 CHAT domain-containing protein [Limnospira sp. PMC 1243.20]MDT9210183.1 CHAT domain-containing protein [Limnospira sp. PMC 1252.20]MDT9215347.1 CHAT domain-containing protein [Limnospira sp. PMC 1256.20]
MKRLMIGSLLGVTMLVATPAIFPILTQRSYAQTSQTQAAQLQQLIDLGLQQTQQRQPLQAIETLKQALAIAQSIPSREGEAFVNLGLGLNYNRSGQPQAALNFYHQAVRLFQEVNDRAGEAATLNSIGEVYRDIGLPQEGLIYFQQALPIRREVSDRATEATTLHNIGAVYGDIGKPQEALTYLQQALPIRREVSDRAREAATLYNIGLVYRDIGEPQKAIDNLEKALKITLEIRAGLAQENRQQFLQNNRAISVALVDLLIDENRPDQAFKWHHLATTFDLADYSHLIDAQVINPPAQKLIDQWNENHERLKLLYAEVDNNWTPELSQQINELQAGNSQIAEDIARQYPEVAELFETTPQDLENLRENIAPGTLVIQPILLTNISEVPDAIALFIVSRDQKAIVKKTPINPSEFDGILTEYRAQLENHNSENFDRNQELLYDYLIRPIEADIAAHSPEKLAIIAPGKLRYIPFETLYDNQRNQHLIEKYPIHYLTRISARRQLRSNTTSSPRVLAFGNPQPSPFDTPGAEQEARQVTEIFSGEYWVREEATRDRFQNDSPRFNILHLANPICFQANGCPGLGLGANQILFAHGETFNIADIGLLGLNQINLVVLSGGFQTGMETESEGGVLAAIAYLFERAGADAVIASLWNAEDNTTLLIMTEFYDNVKQGMTKAEALRQAKLTFAQEGIHPFYWSPLILIGDGGSF